MPPARPAPSELRPAYHHGDLKRALVDAALALVAEEGNWDFSLREVARRAGVSHSAPYNHFADKRELLAAVAAAGFDALRACLEAATADAGPPDAALVALGVAYVRFGADNPAHYRLMFGPTLAAAEGGLPAAVAEAASGAKGVLGEVMARGAREGRFAVPPDSPGLAIVSAWALVHGLTMLLIDGLAATRSGGDGAPLLPEHTSPEHVAETVSRTLLDGVLSRDA